jgi:hypothetical protein
LLRYSMTCLLTSCRVWHKFHLPIVAFCNHFCKIAPTYCFLYFHLSSYPLLPFHMLLFLELISRYFCCCCSCLLRAAQIISLKEKLIIDVNDSGSDFPFVQMMLFWTSFTVSLLAPNEKWYVCFFFLLLFILYVL